jgi:DNA-binding NtrC family response regulator
MRRATSCRFRQIEIQSPATTVIVCCAATARACNRRETLAFTTRKNFAARQCWQRSWFNVSAGMVSAAIEIERDVMLAANCIANVLITGGDGAARRALAERIHKESGVTARFTVVGPGTHLVAADCDSTIFLEDVSLLNTWQQAELLQILEHRRVIDDCCGRIIAASAVRLYDRVVEGRFSVALFYRLNIIHIALRR